MLRAVALKGAFVLRGRASRANHKVIAHNGEAAEKNWAVVKHNDGEAIETAWANTNPNGATSSKLIGPGTRTFTWVDLDAIRAKL
ncbi:hypothetical protein B0H16DRAFT_1709760 [Mycena metata]|uniref:Uncharacterized protein n=1 Tax=Mycena metata TaxID=1033252 RepID=A0AAD7KCM9_9AGAR|nr:hypothetical protein B0H16DRAFT_1709760 [Mycena metata]